MRRSRVAAVAAVLAATSAVLVVGGPLLIALGAAPMTGFSMAGAGAFTGLLALLTGLLALYRTRIATGLTGRGLALFATGLGLASFLAMALPGLQAGSLPPINDITTDLQDPPGFRTAQRPYGGADFARQQQAGYPTLGPLDVALPPSEAFTQARNAMDDLGLVVTNEDARQGHLEGYETTSVFRFVDDVVVRITPTAAGSRIDMRSKSRDGQGDLGANAARIERLQNAIRAGAG